MDDVCDIRHRLAETLRVADGAGADFDIGEMGGNKPRIAGGPQQDSDV
jgi:hypothetical protein